MDDLLEKHSAVVAEANAEHRAELKALRDASDAEIREAIAGFGATMLDVVKAAETAREALSVKIDAILASLAEKAEEAFARNVAAVALSQAECDREREARLTFLRTGALPADKPADPAPPDEAAPADERAAA